MKKVSVIIPVYNVANYITRCIDSVVNQSYENLQIIIIDDGSTDGSGQICDIYSDRRIECIHKENRGLVSARKEGLKRADGDYIVFVDSDDYIKPNMYEKLVEIIEADESDFVHSGFDRIDENDNVLSRETVSTGYCILNDHNEKTVKTILNEYFFSPTKETFITYSIWSKIFRAEFIKKCYEVVPDDQQYGEDVITLLLSLLNADKISVINESMYVQRIRNNSLSHFGFKEALRREFKLCAAIESIYRIYANYIDKEKCWKYIQDRLIYAFEKSMCNTCRIPRYYIEDAELFSEKNICLYGAGIVGEDYYLQLKKMNINVTAVIDRKGKAASFFYSCLLIKPDEISKIKFDLVIIAVLDEKKASEMRDVLNEIGITSDKIFWKKPSLYFE